jgi:SdpC family antimicrobial peptide
MVHFFRKAAFARGMSLLLATSFATVSCAKKEAVNPTVATQVQSDLHGYSGEQLFKGIFLLDGEVAAKLPSLQGPRLLIEKENSRNPAYIKFRALRNQQILEAVRTLDGKYLTELQTAVASQQFEQIEAVLLKGSQLLKAACLSNANSEAQVAKAREALKSIDLTKYDFSKEKDVDAFVNAMEAKKKAMVDAQPQDGSTTSLSSQNMFAFAFEIAVALEAVVVVAIVWVAAKDQSPDSAVFEHETLVKDIALNLNPAI